MELEKESNDLPEERIFNFVKEFETGYTPEKFKAEIHKKINAYP